MARISGAGLLGALTLGAACADDPASPADVGFAVTEDIAMVAADATMDDLASMRDPAEGGSVSGTFSRVVTYYDGAGNVQDGFDALTTAVIAIVVDATREASRSGWEASLEHHRELEVSGLEGIEEKRTWNGTGRTHVERSRHADTDGERSYVMDSSARIDDVVVGVPRSEFPWPLSGAITRDVEATLTTPDGTRTHRRTVVVVFNGTRFAELTIGDATFELDLGARDSDRPVRRLGDRSG